MKEIFIIGLGNPGKKYSKTRHNIGFLILENLAKNKQLKAFKHKGFWSPMDTLNDKNNLEKIWISKKVPWKKWND